MAIPVSKWDVNVQDDISATATTEFHTLAAGGNLYHYARSVLLEIVGSSTPDWTVDIQGKIHSAASYANWTYAQVGTVTGSAVTTAQLSVDDSTARYYLVINPPPYLQVVSTRTGGNLTVRAHFTSEPYALPDQSNLEVTVLASAARNNTGVNSADFVKPDGAKGVILYLDATLGGTTPILDVKVQGKDPVSGKYFDIPGASFTQLTATGTEHLVIYPGVAETANETVSDVLPRTWRIVTTSDRTTADETYTYSVGGVYV